MTAVLMSWLPSNNRVWSEILTCHNPPLPPYRCPYRFWSSGSPSRARAARQQPCSPTATPSQPSTSTGPRAQTPPPRPLPWPNLTPMTFTRSPGLSLRVGVSTRGHREVAAAAGRRSTGWANRRRRSGGRWWREVGEEECREVGEERSEVVEGGGGRMC